MQTERHVRFFRSGSHQALKIPREFEFKGEEAIIRKEGKRLILEPVGIKNRLMEVLETLDTIEEEFPEIEDPHITDEDIF